MREGDVCMVGGERILIVEDDDLMRELLTRILAGENYHISQASSGEEALKLVQDQPVDLVLTDLRLTGMNGLQLLTEIRAFDPEIVVIVMTAYASVETAVEAMRKGAYDYLTKPFINDEIRVMLRRALNQRHLSRENRHLKRELRERYRFENIVGHSEAMEKVYRLIEKVSAISSNVLIVGETGTGKELVARAIHYNSERAERPFVAVNCGALTENLLESELFGHVKGAFTGAIANKEGFFRKADKGTLFLDELSEISHGLQVKLLRAIQEREDIPLLVNHFLQKYAPYLRKPSVKISREAMQVLVNYDWPGNVRELENMIERAVALCEEDFIEMTDLPEKLTQVKIAIRDLDDHEMTLDALEEQHIRKVLQKVNGDKVKAAQILG